MLHKNYGLLVILSFLFFSCNQQRNKGFTNATYMRLVEEKIASLTESNDKATLQDQKTYWGNDSISDQMLSELASRKILFFYFSYNTCSPCIDQSVY